MTIKFRAWDKNKNCWVGGEKAFYLSDQNAPAIEVEKTRSGIELMQFTGLKDKNDKEIYEGDINVNDKGVRSVVVFYAGGFYKKYSDTEYLCIGETTTFERNIIGNIYENPELLTPRPLIAE